MALHAVTFINHVKTVEVGNAAAINVRDPNAVNVSILSKETKRSRMLELTCCADLCQNRYAPSIGPRKHGWEHTVLGHGH